MITKAERQANGMYKVTSRFGTRRDLSFLEMQREVEADMRRAAQEAQ